MNQQLQNNTTMFLGKKSELTQVENEKVIVANGSIPTTENYQSTVEQCRRMPANTTEEPRMLSGCTKTTE